MSTNVFNHIVYKCIYIGDKSLLPIPSSIMKYFYFWPIQLYLKHLKVLTTSVIITMSFIAAVKTLSFHCAFFILQCLLINGFLFRWFVFLNIRNLRIHMIPYFLIRLQLLFEMWQTSCSEQDIYGPQAINDVVFRIMWKFKSQKCS